jgi:membrane protein
MWALNVMYEREETRGFVRRRLTALVMVAFTALGVLLVFGLLVLGPQMTTLIGNAVGEKTVVGWAWWFAQWPVLVAALLVAFAGVYYLGPNVDHPRWRFLSFGALLAIVLWLALSGAFAFYVSRFGSYNKTWGSLSAVVVMLTWLWLSAVALLLGGEINAEAERARELRRGEAAEVESRRRERPRSPSEGSERPALSSPRGRGAAPSVERDAVRPDWLRARGRPLPRRRGRSSA